MQQFFGPGSDYCLVCQSVMLLQTQLMFAKDLSKLFQGFAKVATRICQCCYMHLSKLVYGFVKFLHVFLAQTRPMLKFDQDFKGRCRICLCCSAERTMCVENAQFLTDGIDLDTQGRVQKFSLFLQIMERFCDYETEV